MYGNQGDTMTTDDNPDEETTETSKEQKDTNQEAEPEEIEDDSQVNIIAEPDDETIADIHDEL